MVQQSFFEDPQTSVRTIHYLGGKSRLLPAIGAGMTSLAPPGSRICDLFSGSGVVSQHLAREFDVLAVDVQEYARVLAVAITASVDRTEVQALREVVDRVNARPVIKSPAFRVLEALDADALEEASSGDPTRLCDLVEHGSIVASRIGAARSLPSTVERLVDIGHQLEQGPQTTLTRYYGGVYFSYRQAADLDALATASRRLTGVARDVALAAVIATASELVSTVGNQFAQPIRPRGSDGAIKPAAIKSLVASRRKQAVPAFERWLSRFTRVLPPAHTCTAIRADYRDALSALPSDVRAVYADPPYTRDHYSRFYHVLETIALGDEPKLSTMTLRGTVQLSRGLYRTDRHQSPFCIKSEAPKAFEDLFRSVASHGASLLLSYSPYGDGAHPRVMRVEDIEELAAKFFSDVRRLPVARVAHSKLNADRRSLGKQPDGELLLACRR